LGKFKKQEQQPVASPEEEEAKIVKEQVQKILYNLNSSGRVDFELNVSEGLFNNEYLSSFTAHQSYFTNTECCNFIFKQVYKD
jgi:hypothetical protein